MVSGVQVCNYYPGDAVPQVQANAQQALEEWWLSNARRRPTAEKTAAPRAAPVVNRAKQRAG
jgi:hypothetical protein